MQDAQGGLFVTMRVPEKKPGKPQAKKPTPKVAKKTPKKAKKPT